MIQKCSSWYFFWFKRKWTYVRGSRRIDRDKARLSCNGNTGSLCLKINMIILSDHVSIWSYDCVMIYSYDDHHQAPDHMRALGQGRGVYKPPQISRWRRRTWICTMMMMVMRDCQNEYKRMVFLSGNANDNIEAEKTRSSWQWQGNIPDSHVRLKMTMKKIC